MRKRYLLTGRVQGVGFRWWTARTARSLRLRGTVRNLPDGRVEVRVEGDAAVLRRFRDLLSVGPPGAHVEQIEEEPDSGPLPRDFRILA